MKTPKYRNKRFYCCETCGRRYKLKMLVPGSGCCKDSLLWDSEKEYNRWRELKLLEKAGKICKLSRQEPILFDVIYLSHCGYMGEGNRHRETIKYIPDFTYFTVCETRSGLKFGDKFIVEDSKGYCTKEYKKKKMLMKKIYGIDVRET